MKRTARLEETQQTHNIYIKRKFNVRQVKHQEWVRRQHDFLLHRKRHVELWELRTQQAPQTAVGSHKPADIYANSRRTTHSRVRAWKATKNEELVRLYWLEKNEYCNQVPKIVLAHCNQAHKLNVPAQLVMLFMSISKTTRSVCSNAAWVLLLLWWSKTCHKTKLTHLHDSACTYIWYEIYTTLRTHSDTLQKRVILC